MINVTFLKERIASFLATMAEPFRSMPIDTDEDREALAAALREYAVQRPMPPNASEMEK